MKFIIIVALCIFAAKVKGDMKKEEAMEVFREVAVACAAETGATNADIEVMMKHLPAQNKETKCLRACAMKTFKLLTAEGKFNMEVALKTAEIYTQANANVMKVAQEVANICQVIAVPDDLCDAAELYERCLFDETEKRGIKLT